MRTIETYAELTQKAQEKALAKYNVQGYVHDTDSQLEILAMLGFDDPKVHWSGFYAQCSGSCFEGVWYPKNMDIEDIKNQYPQWTELHTIAKNLSDIIAEYPTIYNVSVIHSGGHYNENSMTMQCIDDESEDVAYESQFMEECKSLARLFHKQIENEFV
jgi:hypothetical protein